jgi:hypothetical protein
MTVFPDTFALHADSQALIARLRLMDAFAHLREIRIAAIGSQNAVMLRGNPVRAWIGMPHVQGAMAAWHEWALAEFCRPLLEGLEPDFLMMVDLALWAAASDEQRERLVYHELCHLRVKEDPETGLAKLDDEGRPRIRVVPHDVEVFTAEVARYGPAVTELDELLAAVLEHSHRTKRKRPA